MKIQTLLFAVLFIISGCNGKSANSNSGKSTNHLKAEKSQQEYVKSMRLKSPQRGQQFRFGDAIDIVVRARNKAGAIDSIQLWGDGKWVKTITSEPWNLKWIPTLDRMGKHDFKLKAYHENGTIGIVSTYVYLKSDRKPDEYAFEIVKSYPHDRRAYTQGLFYHDGYLYEGTGQHGESSLRKEKLENGEVISVKNLEQEYFGEGITLSKGKIFQLTWQAGKVFVVDPESFEQIDYFHPQTSNGQGWGITSMKNELVISDGTNVLTMLDDQSYSKISSVEVYDENGKVTNLNELEYINGKIFANVWLTDRIVIINPETGRVEGNLNLSALLKHSERNKLIEGDEVLNGIAWDEENKRLFVTGKRWPKLFEIKISKK